MTVTAPDRTPPVRSGSYDPVISVTVMPALNRIDLGRMAARQLIAFHFPDLLSKSGFFSVPGERRGLS
jgi:hypothetical protein